MPKKHRTYLNAIFNEDSAIQVLELIAHGEPLTKLCRRADMPSYSTVLR